MEMMDKAFVGKLEGRLRFIYKQSYSEEILAALLNILSLYKQRKTDDKLWDEKDVVLITYGDSIQSDKEVPLQTLRSFLTKNLKEQISVVHILQRQ